MVRGKVPARLRESVAANARLTSGAAAVLFVLLAIEGLTLLGIRHLTTLHVVVGLALVPPVLLKLGSTGYRFVKYYLGDPAYREKGPPPALLRLLGPFVVVLTFAVIGTGVALLLVPPGWKAELLFLHKASFVLWFGATAVHVLGHVLETVRLAPRDWSRRTRRRVAGAGARQWLLVTSVAAGLLLGITFAPYAGRFLPSSASPRASGAGGAPAPSPAGAVSSTRKSLTDLSTAPGPVTVIGDSVTLDAAPALVALIPGCRVLARVGEQWEAGVRLLGRLRASGRLPSEVVIALGANGPVTPAELSQMMRAARGAKRVVVVTDHAPVPWVPGNNALFESEVPRYPDATVANWARLAAAHPAWFYPDGTHMPIGGPGAYAFARLVRAAL